MMEAGRKEMMLYLQKDNVYGWRFKNKKIKKYVKSLSFDMCIPDDEDPLKPVFINVGGAITNEYLKNDTSDQ
jgi:hypothetical protein